MRYSGANRCVSAPGASDNLREGESGFVSNSSNSSSGGGGGGRQKSIYRFRLCFLLLPLSLGSVLPNFYFFYFIFILLVYSLHFIFSFVYLFFWLSLRFVVILSFSSPSSNLFTLLLPLPQSISSCLSLPYFLPEHPHLFPPSIFSPSHLGISSLLKPQSSETRVQLLLNFFHSQTAREGGRERGGGEEEGCPGRERKGGEVGRVGEEGRNVEE